MTAESMDDGVQAPVASGTRAAWTTPTIEDADISAITNGTGTSGVEGSAFLKPGS